MLQRGVNKPYMHDVRFRNPVGEFHVSASQKRMMYLHLFVTYPHALINNPQNLRICRTKKV